MFVGSLVVYKTKMEGRRVRTFMFKKAFSTWFLTSLNSWNRPHSLLRSNFINKPNGCTSKTQNERERGEGYVRKKVWQGKGSLTNNGHKEFFWLKLYVQQHDPCCLPPVVASLCYLYAFLWPMLVILLTFLFSRAFPLWFFVLFFCFFLWL